jgi:hypothetical protein
VLEGFARGEEAKRKGLPSSFFKTRSIAPEQPPQVIVMLNL